MLATDPRFIYSITGASGTNPSKTITNAPLKNSLLVAEVIVTTAQTWSSISPPAGWAKWNPSDATKLCLFYKISDTTETSFAITLGTASGWDLIIKEWVGANITTPISNDTRNTNSTTTAFATSTITNTPGGCVPCVFTQNNNTSTMTGVTAGYLQDFASGTNGRGMSFHGPQTTAGGSAQMTGTLGTGTTSSNMIYLINPAPDSGGGKVKFRRLGQLGFGFAA